MELIKGVIDAAVATCPQCHTCGQGTAQQGAECVAVDDSQQKCEGWGFTWNAQAQTCTVGGH